MLLACTCTERAAGILGLGNLLKKWWRTVGIHLVNNTCLRKQPVGTNSTVAFNLTQTGPVSLKCQARELNQSKTRLATLIIVRTKF